MNTDSVLKENELNFTEIFDYPVEYTGESRESKLNRIREKMAEKSADYLILIKLDDIAWATNLRGRDVPETPVFFSYMIIGMDQAYLFVNKEAITNANVDAPEIESLYEIRDYDSFFEDLKDIAEGNVWIDEKNMGEPLRKDEDAIYEKMMETLEGCNIRREMNPVTHMKTIKNATEIEGMKKAHEMESITLQKLFDWILENVGKIPMTEVGISEKLEEFRHEWPTYIEPSFTTIVGYKDHGAIIHYRPAKETDYEVKPEGMMVIDAGGQYMEGTTDMTRTLILGEISDEMKLHYRAVREAQNVLKDITFDITTTGKELDDMVREPIKAIGLDYAHGTGHGVGHLLHVHEDPVRINQGRQTENGIKENTYTFEPGVIVSNEPGIYIEGSHGIRIEDLMLCVEREDGRLGFEVLTKVPYQDI